MTKCYELTRHQPTTTGSQVQSISQLSIMLIKNCVPTRGKFLNQFQLKISFILIMENMFNENDYFDIYKKKPLELAFYILGSQFIRGCIYGIFCCLQSKYGTGVLQMYLLPHGSAFTSFLTIQNINIKRVNLHKSVSYLTFYISMAVTNN